MRTVPNLPPTMHVRFHMLAALAIAHDSVPTRSVPAGPRAELRLTVERAILRRGEAPVVHASIRNTGRTPLNLIEPQEGSDDARRNPSVVWAHPDAPKRRPLWNCGNLSEIGPTAFFTLAPGERRELRGREFEWALAPGRNRATLTYDIAAERIDASPIFIPFFTTPAQERRMREERARIDAAYAKLTPIHLTSNTIEIRVEPAP